MAKDLLGIDIGTGYIKLVTNSSYLTIDTPDNALNNDELIAFDGMGDLIKETLKTNNLKNKNVALVLPDSSVYINRFTMPYMSIKQLETNLPYEFKDVVGKNKDYYLYDYAYISNDGKNMDILGGAIEKTLIDKYSEMFKKAGLKLVKATPRVMAISDILKTADLKNDVALVDLGYSYTKVDMYKDGFYHTSKTIDKGIKDMVKLASEILFVDEHIAKEYLKDNKEDVLNNQKLLDLYEDIAINITRAINYYIYENGDNTLENLYIYGGGTYIKPFVEAIKASSPLETKEINDLFNNSNEVYKEALSAYGAIRG